MDVQMKAHDKVLTQADEIQTLAKTLSEAEMIAIDTEFIRESTFFPVIALIQVATTKESWLVDPLALSEADLEPLFKVFSNPKVLKILHAAQADQECLFTNYGVIATPSFDTAVGASLAGYGDSIGLSKLVKDCLNVSLRKGHARTDWTVRPLQDHLLNYAHSDVQYLIPIAKKLLSELNEMGRASWAMDLSARMEDKKLYEPNPEGLARKLAKSGKVDRRGFAVLRELLMWRESRVRQLDVPRRRVADDDVLVDLANVRPKDLTHLSAFRGLNRGEFKHSGEAILAAIRRGMQVAEDQLVDVPRPEIADAREARSLDLIRCFVKILAEDLHITARHLINAEDLLPLLRKDFHSVDEIVREEILTPGAASLVGEELLAMVQGKRALAISSGDVKIVKSN